MNNSKLDINKYIVEQANIEIEYVRSWPTKVMAFYVAINFGVIGAIIALQNIKNPVQLSCCMKLVITIMLSILTFHMLYILKRSNGNYIDHRDLQIDLQKKLFEEKRDEYNLPKEWFEKKEGFHYIKYPGWLLYGYIVIMIAFLVIPGIWLIG